MARNCDLLHSSLSNFVICLLLAFHLREREEPKKETSSTNDGDTLKNSMTVNGHVSTLGHLNNWSHVSEYNVGVLPLGRDLKSRPYTLMSTSDGVD